MRLVRPVLVFRMPERNRFRDRVERPPSLVDGLASLTCRAAQALQVANHVVEPRLSPVEESVPFGSQEEKGEAGTNGRARKYFRQLRLLIHTSLLLPKPTAFRRRACLG